MGAGPFFGETVAERDCLLSTIQLSTGDSNAYFYAAVFGDEGTSGRLRYANGLRGSGSGSRLNGTELKARLRRDGLDRSFQTGSGARIINNNKECCTCVAQNLQCRVCRRLYFSRFCPKA